MEVEQLVMPDDEQTAEPTTADGLPLCSDGEPGHYEDNQGCCHSCGVVVNQAQYDAYMAGAWT